MRALFERFEYVTTDGLWQPCFSTLSTLVPKFLFGAHRLRCFRENYLSDNGCAAYPEAIDILLSEETKRKGEVYLGPLRVDPWIGVQNVDLGKLMLVRTTSSALRKCEQHLAGLR